MTKNALIYIELDDGNIKKVSKEIISHALKNFNGYSINAVLICDEKSLNSAQDELNHSGLQNLYIIKNELGRINTSFYAQILADFISDNKPDIFLMGATTDGRDIAPRTASRLNIGLTADCTDLQIDEAGKLLATRPTYGGKMMATIISMTTPNFATVRPGAFKYDDSVDITNNVTCITYIQPVTLPQQNNPEIISAELKAKTEDWTCSDMIIAGGLGLKSKENFDLIYKLAELLNAKPAASRAAVEQNWAPQNIQIGQTGHSVSPKLYIAFGISGAMQHTVGITNADRIIAVNNDKNSPIMKLADFAITQDAAEVIKTMINKLSH